LEIPTFVKNHFVKIPKDDKKNEWKITLFKIRMTLPLEPEGLWGDVLVDERMSG
jgi:hypothetical protein